jgi:hypothetical protein
VLRNTKAGFNLTGGKPSSLNALISHCYQGGVVLRVEGWQIAPLGDSSARVVPGV